MSSPPQTLEPEAPADDGLSSRWVVAGIVIWALLAAGMIGLWIWLQVEARDWEMIDLAVYRWGGTTVRTSDALYTSAWHDWLPFTYTPFASLVFISASLLPVWAVQSLFFIANGAGLIWVVNRSFRSLGYAPSRRLLGISATIAAGCLALEPVTQTLSFGQINIFIMVMVIADLVPLRERRYSGIWLGIAAGLKLTPAIFIVFCLVTRRFALAARAGAAFVATVALGYLLIPHESSQFWQGRLFMDPTRVGGPAYAGNQSVNGVLNRLFERPEAARLGWVLVGGAAVVVTFALGAWYQRRGQALVATLLCALGGLLVSPISWSHHWVWIAPVMVVAVDAIRRRVPYAKTVTVALVVVFCSATKPPGMIWMAGSGDDVEQHWSGGQLLTGNAYVLVAVAALVAIAVGVARQRAQDRGRGPDAVSVSGRSREGRCYGDPRAR